MHTQKEIDEHYQRQRDAAYYAAKEFVTVDDFQDNIWMLSDYVYDLTTDYIDFNKANKSSSGIKRELIKEELKKKISKKIDDLFDFNEEQFLKDYENDY